MWFYKQEAMQEVSQSRNISSNAQCWRHDGREGNGKDALPLPLIHDVLGFFSPRQFKHLYTGPVKLEISPTIMLDSFWHSLWKYAHPRLTVLYSVSMWEDFSYTPKQCSSTSWCPTINSILTLFV